MKCETDLHSRNSLGRHDDLKALKSLKFTLGSEDLFGARRSNLQTRDNVSAARREVKGRSKLRVRNESKGEDENMSACRYGRRRTRE